MKKLLNLLKSDIARIALSLIFFILALILEQTLSPWGTHALYVVAPLTDYHSTDGCDRHKELFIKQIATQNTSHSINENSAT